MLAEIPEINNFSRRLDSVFEFESPLKDFVYKSYLKAATKILEDYSKPGSERYRAYHNFEHTSAVLNAVLDMDQNAPENEKLGSEELALLLVAASYHDSVVETGREAKQNEVDSADLAVTELADVIDLEQLEVVQKLIESTYTKVTVNGLIRPVKVVERIGNYRTELMSKLLQDADISSLGTDGFARATVGLAEEWGKSDTGNFRSFLEAQLQILKNHEYQTESAENTFNKQSRNYEILSLYLEEKETTTDGFLEFFDKQISN